MRLKDYAQQNGVSMSTAYRLFRENKIPGARKIGRTVTVPDSLAPAGLELGGGRDLAAELDATSTAFLELSFRVDALAAKTEAMLQRIGLRGTFVSSGAGE